MTERLLGPEQPVTISFGSTKSKMEARQVYNLNDSEKFIVSESVLRNHLRDFHEEMGKSRDFLTPLALVLSIGLSLVTSDFQESARLPAATWEAGYWMTLILSIGWLAVSLYRRKRPITVDIMVTRMKESGRPMRESAE